MPTRKEMSMRHPFLRIEGNRIDRAQAHGMRKALDGLIRFTEPQFDPAADRPTHRHIRINEQSSVQEGSIIIEHPGTGERQSGDTECRSIVLIQLDSPTSQPNSFGKLLLSVSDPAKSYALRKTHRGRGIRRREIRIKFNGFVKQTESCPFASLAHL